MHVAAAGHLKSVRMLMDLEYVDITKKSRDGGLTAEEIAPTGVTLCRERV